MIRYIVGLVYLMSLGLDGQHLVTGKVVDKSDKAVGFCHVVNSTLDMGKVSDMKGKFGITAKKGDTIRFSYVGFQDFKIVVGSEHLSNYLKVQMVEDSVLLPSITIYADPYYRVPINYQGEPIFIEGVSIPGERRPVRPGSIQLGTGSMNAMDPLAPGFTLVGPITYLSKDEREKRQAAEARKETLETITYQKLIAQDTIRTKLCKMYALDSAEYDEVIIRLHHQFPDIQKTGNKYQIWNWLVHHFDRTVPVIKDYALIFGKD